MEILIRLILIPLDLIISLGFVGRIAVLVVLLFGYIFLLFKKKYILSTVLSVIVNVLVSPALLLALMFNDTSSTGDFIMVISVVLLLITSLIISISLLIKNKVNKEMNITQKEKTTV